jgi:hypothetical protein
VQRKTFGLNRNYLRGEWRRLRNEDLYDLCSSPSIIRVIKSRRMRWVVHVERVGDRTGACRVLWGALVERDNLEDLAADGSIILK